MALNKKIAVLAFDKQTAFGTAAANRKYGFGLRSGTLYTPGIEDQAEELTLVNRFPPSAIRIGANPTIGPLTTRAWARSVVMLLENALGSRATAGAGDPFTHTITPADVPGYLTMFPRLDNVYHRVRDCRVASLSFSWNKREPVEMGLTLNGTISTLYHTSGDPTTDDSDQVSFYPAGGTFEWDVDGSTLATADVTAGNITISTGLAPVELSRQIEPTDQWPGAHIITVQLTVIPTNLDDWRTVVTGTPSGTAIGNAPVYGSTHQKFIYATSPERSLDLSAPRIALIGPFPDPDPAGGPVELTLEGTVYKPAAGAAFTAVVKNQEAATNYAGS